MVAVQLQQGAEARVNAKFMLNAELNRDKTKEAGRPIYDDKELCEIRFAGNKHTVGAFYAHDIADWFDDPVTGERRERTYAEKYNAEYLAFKRGAPEAASGTPLSELTFLTEGKRRELRALNIFTAEALASLDDRNLKNLGMGGRDLMDKAKAYLVTASETASTADMQAKIDALEARIAALSAGGPADDAPAEDSAKANEIADAFKDYSNEDLKNWLTEAGVTVEARWNRVTLLARCREVLDKSGKQKQAA